MVDTGVAEASLPQRARRERSRRRRFEIDKQQIVARVIRFFDEDDQARSVEKEARVQRYAKYRLYTEGKDWPWQHSSDIALSDMTEKSLKIQDTLHNAVMSSRPVMGAKALDAPDAGKEPTIDKLIDVQVFIEQKGEVVIGSLADAFTNDGVMTAFIPWVKEMRETSDVRVFPKIPADSEPIEYFAALLKQEFPEATALPVRGGDGWDWRLSSGGDVFEASFYTKDRNRKVELVVKRQVEVYNGPKIIDKEWDDVVYPARTANLQIPGPSNPHGASHVILRDYPTVDEVKRLKRQGVYDKLTKDDIAALETTSQEAVAEEKEEAKDAIAGSEPSPPPKPEAASQRTVTRLMCFDTFDIDGDGIDEDVVWWVIRDIKALARAKLLTEVFPAPAPRRPLAGSSFIPIRGRYGGISQLEILEGLHDAMKMLLDQAVDSGTIKNVPFWFYRPHGSMKPEIIRFSPGEGYPLNDPKNDVFFPQIGGQDQVFHINMLTILTQMEERLSTIGDLQLGRVPQGRSSALRTFSGMALIAGQGEARPERILRRFFMGLAEIWTQIHDLNRYFLPDEKKIRVIGLKQPSEDPFLVINRRDIAGPVEFEFKANVLNTSKAALQQSIQAAMGTYITELAFQLGISDANTVYQLFREHGFAWGLDPDRLIKPPSADSMKPRLFAEEAISQILDGDIPDGRPAEAGGATEHLQKLQAFVADERFGLFDANQVEIFKGYIQEVAEKAAEEQRQTALLAAAQAFGQGAAPGQPGRPPQGPPEAREQMGEMEQGEIIDETLPGAGGGGNVGFGLT